MPGNTILEIKDATKKFGGITAVNNCSLSVAAGEISGLIGPNGSGKTTLFNCITGLERLHSGAILFNGQRIDGLKPHRVARRGIGRTFQVIRVFPQLTAFENLLAVTDAPIDAARQRAEELLAFVKLERLREEYAGNLSYGQQKLLEFIRVLMTDPELILLDEPAAGVNRTLLNELLDVLRRLRDQGKTILIVEHDMKVVMGLCDKVFVLDYGEKIAEGPPSLIQGDERVIEAYFGR
jgi:ABC-type branched-subunit amino acid transport system ATPase component